MTFDFLEQDSGGFFTLAFRVVRMCLDGGQRETLLTNLDAKGFPPKELKVLYAKRWGIETSFRSLKYAVGLIYLHAKKPELVLQEIYASFIVYNYTQAVVWGVDTDCGRSKYRRHVNFSKAVHLCCAFLRKPVGDLYALLAQELVPYRPDRSAPRVKIADNRISFSYHTVR